MSATKNSHDWHCEEHGTYGWRGESCRQCPEAPSKIKSLRAQIAEFKAENEQLRMALADTESLEIGTAERCDELTRQRDEYKADAERFEWMLDHPDATVCSDGSYGPVHIWFRYSNRLVGYGSKTAREAIDAAMKGATE